MQKINQDGRMFYKRLAVLVGLLFVPLVVFSEQLVSPPVPVISAPEVKDLMERTPSTLLINTLSRIEFLQQRIPGSINIPAPDVATTPLLKAEDERIKIFYCMGVKCAYSRHAVEMALRRGLKNIYWFRGGIPEWRQFDYPMEVNPVYAAIKVNKLRCDRVRSLLADPSVLVLDVRPVWVSGKQYFLPGTLHVQMTDLDRQLKALPRNRSILVTDVTMRQSISAARFLKHQGFNVRGVVRGGLQHGARQGCPVSEKPSKSLSGWGVDAP